MGFVLVNHFFDNLKWVFLIDCNFESKKCSFGYLVEIFLFFCNWVKCSDNCS